jgi:hypothetical protein
MAPDAAIPLMVCAFMILQVMMAHPVIWTVIQMLYEESVCLAHVLIVSMTTTAYFPMGL